jgi:hypothetical protein
MRNVLILFVLLAAFCARAVEKVTLQITITNLPVTGDNLSFSAPASKVITWSNTTSSAWVATNTTVNSCATNLFLQMAAYAPWSPRPGLQWVNTNSFYVFGECGATMAVTNSGTWATLVLDTNDCARQLTVNVPVSAEKFATSRVYIASMVAKALNDYPTNTFDTNAAVLANFLSLGPHPQTVTGLKTFNQFGGTNKTTIWGGTNDGTRIQNASYLNGTSGSYTNLYTTNQVLDVPKMTNATVYGGFSSYGALASGTVETTSLQAGGSASATNSGAIALGGTSLAGGGDSISLGYGARSLLSGDIAIGLGTTANGAEAIAIGNIAEATAPGAMALGPGAIAAFTNSMGIGVNATPEAANQIMLGSANASHVRTFGRLEAGSITNAVHTGTNVNKGAWSDTPVTITSLANGNNVLNPANAKVIRLAAGPTAAFGINSIQGGWDGRDVEVWNDTGQAITVYHESGFDATNVNRIITTGADVVFGTNVYLNFRYFESRSRWKLSGSRE